MAKFRKKLIEILDQLEKGEISTETAYDKILKIAKKRDIKILKIKT